MKKKKSFQLRIPSPCTQRWETLIPQTEGLRYCTKCTKNIIDLTDKTDREIGALYKKSKGNICGRVRTNQLNRPIQVPSDVSSLRLKAAGLLLSGLLTAGTLQAQTTTPIPTEQTRPVSAKHQKPTTTPSKSVIIKGKVIDKDNGDPLFFADISVESGNQFYSKTTSEIGLFEFKIDLPAILYFHPIGYETVTLDLKEIPKEPLIIEMKTGLDLADEFTEVHEVLLGIVIEDFEEDEIPPPPLEEPSETIIKSVILPPTLRTNIYPNPYKSKLNVAIQVEEKASFELLVTNEAGQTVFKQSIEVKKGDNLIRINLKKYTLKLRTYFLSILENGEIRQTKMIIKK